MSNDFPWHDRSGGVHHATADMVPVTDVEARLADDRDGSVRADIVQRMHLLEERLASQLQAGLPRDQFALWQALLTATVTARGIYESWTPRIK